MTAEALAFVGIAVLVVAGGIFWAMRSGKRSRGGRPPYIVALGAIADGDRETAFAEFKNAVRIDSGNVDAYLRLGDLFRARGDAERAYQIHRELSTRSQVPVADRARIFHSLSLDLVALGRFEKATEAIRESVKLAEDPLPGLDAQLDILKRREDVEGAFRVRKEILKRQGKAKTGNPELSVFRAEQAEALLEKGALEQAEKVLKDARKLDPSNVQASFLWGRLKEKQGQYPAAIEAWNGILRDAPEKVVRLFRSLERVRFLDGSFSEMESTYGTFLERVPDHEDASFGLARLLRRKGNLDGALEACGRGLEAHPESESLRVLHLALLLQAGRTGEAGSELNEWISGILGVDDPGAPAPAAVQGPAAGIESSS